MVEKSYGEMSRGHMKMEKILQHLRCIGPLMRNGIEMGIDWCRISEPSTVAVLTHFTMSAKTRLKVLSWMIHICRTYLLEM